MLSHQILWLGTRAWQACYVRYRPDNRQVLLPTQLSSGSRLPGVRIRHRDCTAGFRVPFAGFSEKGEFVPLTRPVPAAKRLLAALPRKDCQRRPGAPKDPGA